GKSLSAMAARKASKGDRKYLRQIARGKSSCENEAWALFKIFARGAVFRARLFFCFYGVRFDRVSPTVVSASRCGSAGPRLPLPRLCRLGILARHRQTRRRAREGGLHGDSQRSRD